MRAAGRPGASAVASVIAFGSGTPPRDAVVEPARELRERIAGDVALVEGRPLVVGPKIGERGGRGGRRGHCANFFS